MWKKRGKEGEGEEKGGRERRIKNREGDTRSVPPPPDAFPSAKLGNNITPIKGRLGKNTTPTSRDPIKLNRNLQTNPPQRQSNFEIPSRASLIYKPRKTKSPEYGLQSNIITIYKEAKALGKARNHFKFSINWH